MLFAVNPRVSMHRVQLNDLSMNLKIPNKNIKLVFIFHLVLINCENDNGFIGELVDK
jgi:hypothetical protein